MRERNFVRIRGFGDPALFRAATEWFPAVPGPDSLVIGRHREISPKKDGALKGRRYEGKFEERAGQG